MQVNCRSNVNETRLLERRMECSVPVDDERKMKFCRKEVEMGG